MSDSASRVVAVARPSPCGVNLTKCSKCGGEYNAAVPVPHQCGPSFSRSGPVKKDDKVVQNEKVIKNGKGVNTVTCNSCGAKYNACLPTKHECGPKPPSKPAKRRSKKNGDSSSDLDVAELDRVLAMKLE